MNKNSKTALMIAGGATAGYCAGRFLRWNNKSIVTTEYTYHSERVPKIFRGARIVNVSDLQSQYFGNMQADLLNRVKAAKPDYILMTGDLLDRNHTDRKAAICALSGLLTLAPVYYVNGNHELALPEEKMWRFYRTMEEMGTHLVFDDVVSVSRGDESINIMGISEYTLYGVHEVCHEQGADVGEAALADMVDEISAEKDQNFTLLLAHEPQHIKSYSRPGIDMIFCGHAHGGQFRLPGGQGLYSPGQGVLPQLASGAHRCGGSTMIVSRGLGNSVFPFRLNNRPELVVVTLER